MSLPQERSTAEQVFYTWVARSRSGSSSFTASALNKLSSSSSSSSSSCPCTISFCFAQGLLQALEKKSAGGKPLLGFSLNSLHPCCLLIYSVLLVACVPHHYCKLIEARVSGRHPPCAYPHLRRHLPARHVGTASPLHHTPW